MGNQRQVHEMQTVQRQCLRLPDYLHSCLLAEEELHRLFPILHAEVRWVLSRRPQGAEYQDVVLLHRRVCC